MKRAYFFCFVLLSVIFFSYGITIIELIPVGANEAENIDSFNAHPALRWDTTLTSSMETLTVSNGILNYSDTGDPNESSARSRQLQKTDFKIEGRLKTPVISGTNPTIFENETEIRDTGFALENFTGHDGPTTYFFQNEDTGHDENGAAWTFYGFDTPGFPVGAPEDVFLMMTGDPRGIASRQWGSGNFEAVALTGNILLSNYTLETRARDISGGDYFGVCFRYNNATTNHTLYETSVHSGNDMVYLWKHYVNGSRLLLANQTIPLAHQEWVNITVEAAGNNYKIYTNGTLRIDYTDNDNPFLYGYTGLYSLYGNQKQMWDWFTLESNATNTFIRTSIGISDVETTLDLDLPGAAIIFESYMNRSEVAVYYTFCTNNVAYETNFFNITSNLWVRFEMDIDLLRSQIAFEMTYDNETEIAGSSKNILDISAIHEPEIFAASTLDIFYGNNFLSDSDFTNASTTFFIDFLKAPYEEFQFKHNFGVEQSNDQFLFVNEFGGIGTSNGTTFTSQSQWQYVVPEFDSITGVIHASVNVSDEADLDDVSCTTALKVGTLSTAYSYADWVVILVGYSLGAPTVQFVDADGTNFEHQIGPSGASMLSAVEVGFTIYKNSENKLITQIATQGEVYTFSYTINTTTHPYSSEVIVQTLYTLHSINNAQDVQYTFGIRDFETQFRDLLGFLPDLPDVDEAVGAITDVIGSILMQGFRFLGTIFTVVMSPILDAVTSLLSPLNGILSGITSIFSSLGDVLDELTGDINDYLSDIPTILTDLQGLATVVTGIAAAVGAAIWTAIIAEVNNILTKIITELGNLASSVADLLRTFAAWIWDNGVETIVVGISDLIDDAIWGIVELLSYWVFMYALIIDFMPLAILLLTLYIFFLSALDHADDPAAWVGDLTKRFFINMSGGLTFFGIGIPVPLGVIWIMGALLYGWQPW